MAGAAKNDFEQEPVFLRAKDGHKVPVYSWPPLIFG